MNEIATFTEDTPWQPEDDQYHVLSDDRFETETNWWALNWPERKMGSWLHVARHPNQDDTCIWRVFVWDAENVEPSRLAYYKRGGPLPMPANADLRDIQFPGGGYYLKNTKPGMDYYVNYKDAENNFSMEFEFKAVHPPHRFSPGEPPAMFNPHFDQHGHYTGEMVLRGEKIPIDSWCVRDRTWGPRGGAHSQSQKPDYVRGEYRVAQPGGPKWREIERERGRGRIQYIFGHHEADTGFLSFVRPQDGDAKGWSPMNMGWLLKDGVFTRLDKNRSKMRVWRNPVTGLGDHMEVLCVDRTGRTLEAEGQAVSRICEGGAGQNALYRWDMDGKVGWGEDQDGWRGDHFTKMLNALRAPR
jgi:hypothetical protein